MGPSPAREERRGNAVEVSFGYLGQWTDERTRSLELKPSASDPPQAGFLSGASGHPERLARSTLST